MRRVEGGSLPDPCLHRGKLFTEARLRRRQTWAMNS
jgi:hypothetical protein